MASALRARVERSLVFDWRSASFRSPGALYRRRRVSEFYMYGLVVLLFLLFLHNPVVQTVLPALLIVMVVIMVVEGYLVGRKVTAMAAERFPGESTRGIKIYSAMRSLQIRQLRFPKPRVKPGATV
jgi:hypothetical protein